MSVYKTRNIPNEKQRRREGWKRVFMQLNLIEIERKCFWNWYSGQNVNGEIGFCDINRILARLYYIVDIHGFYDSCTTQIILKPSRENSTRAKIKNNTFYRIEFNWVGTKSVVIVVAKHQQWINRCIGWKLKVRRGKFFCRCCAFQCNTYEWRTHVYVVWYSK